MAKSMLKDIRKFVKTAAKATLYITGGTALAWPLVVGATNLAHGTTPRLALESVAYQGMGWSAAQNKIDTTQFTNAVMRTGYGALAIYVAGKI